MREAILPICPKSTAARTTTYVLVLETRDGKNPLKKGNEQSFQPSSCQWPISGFTLSVAESLIYLELVSTCSSLRFQKIHKRVIAQACGILYFELSCPVSISPITHVSPLYATFISNCVNKHPSLLVHEGRFHSNSDREAPYCRHPQNVGLRNDCGRTTV
ncbi:hypothetical protein BJV78DRAFT_753543 [Lactifluus subvellereus]|nr:hypothetical protein BJV78DRAFT_753543 [Lactifluus subvellereus]